MKRFKKVITALSLLVAGVGLWAQAPVNTPDATEIVRYGRIPVSYYNGLPNIEVPLYDINVADINLPISLSYNASGIKVNQYPTTVGLGWSLNAGGGIYRVVNGLQDETVVEDVRDETGYLISGTQPGYFHYSQFLNSSWTTIDYNTNLYNSLQVIRYDTEPDEFVINAYGLSGSIFFYRDHDGVLMNKVRSNNGEDFTVEGPFFQDEVEMQFPGYDGSSPAYLPARKLHHMISGFRVIKSDGTVLHFGGTNAMEFYSEKRVGPDGLRFMKTIPSAWKLNKIESPSGRIVEFEYNRNGSPIIVSDVRTNMATWSDGAPGNWAQVSSFDKSFTVQHPVYLTEIRVEGGMVLKLGYTKRNDYPTLNSDDISYLRSYDGFGVLNGAGFSDGSTYDWGSLPNSVKYAPHNYSNKLFQISVFSQDDDFHALEVINFQYIENCNERLKLEKVLIKNHDIETVQTYSFRYNPLHLPPYNATVQDIWGYYNNKDYRANHITPANMKGFRTPDLTFACAEILEEVTYPTGGSLGLVYELHDYSKEATQIPDFDVVDRIGVAGGLRIKELNFLTDSRIYRHRFEYKDTNGSSSGILSGSPVYEDQGSIHESYNHDNWSGIVHYRYKSDYTQRFSISSESYLNPCGMPTGNHVTYSRVQEYIDDVLVKEYQYTNHDDYPDAQEYSFFTNYDGRGLMAAFTSNSIMRGLLSSEKWYSNGAVVKRVDYEYFDGRNSGNYMKCIAYGLVKGLKETPYVRYTPYREFTFYPYVTRMVETEYGETGSPQIMKQSERYEYNDHLQKTSVARTLSNDSVETTSIKYPDDFTAGVCEQLVEKKAFGLPIEVVKMRDGKIVGGVFNKYGITAEGAIVKVSENILSITEPLPENEYHWYDGDRRDGRYVENGNVEKYDSHANPVRIECPDGRIISYLWDKSGLNPLCSITNAANRGRILSETHEREWVNSVYHINIAEVQSRPVSFNFLSTADGYCSIQMDVHDGYDWYITGTLDGEPFSLATHDSSLPVAGLWWSYLNNSYHLEMNLSAGLHEVIIDNLLLRRDGTSTLTEFELMYSYPMSIDYVVTEGTDEFLYENFENLDSPGHIVKPGYNSEYSYRGAYHIHMIGRSSRSYMLDYRVKRNGSWEYVRMPLPSRDYYVSEGQDPIDDVRVWPVDSQIETYNWYPYVGLRSRTGGDGVTESYQYDDFSRLCSVKDDSGNIIRTFSYHYQDDNDPGNRLETSILRNPGVFEFDSADSLASTSKNRVVKHYDGLGFPIQEIQIGAADGTHDIITHREYDAYMRENRRYLPYVDMSDSGNHIRTHAADSTVSFYASGVLAGLDDPTLCPFSETVFENSLLDRVLQKGAPGETWQPSANRDSTSGRSVTTSLKTCLPNGFDKCVKIWKVSGNNLVSKDCYSSGTLKCTVTKDENWESGTAGTFESYMDNNGKVVLERRWTTNSENQAIYLDTYYVYDDLDRLRYVLPPILSDVLSAGGSFTEENADILKYAYVYKYNGRGDCVYKKLPGAEPVRMRYNSNHRLAWMQDGNLAESDKYVFNYYDAAGRIVISGVSSYPFTDNPSNPECSARYTGNGPVFGYELLSTLRSDAIVNKVDYYDSYDFIGIAPSSARDSLAAGDNDTRYGHGRKTGSIRWTLGDDRLPLYSSFYYDEKGNPAASHSMNILGGWETEKTSYSFTGVPTQRVLSHSVADGPSFTEHYSYNYDNMDRLVEIRHRINDGNDVVLTENTYNQLGQLINVRRNGCDSLTTNYTYNIRGWLTSINNPIFSETMYYNNLRNGIGSNTPCYNGNISAMDWNVSGDVLRGFDYGYDPLDRLIRADYLENGVRMTNFDCEYSYDAHGNILTSSRNGLLSNGQYGNLGTTTMIYNGNQLSSCLARVLVDFEQPVFGSDFLPIGHGTFPGAFERLRFSYDSNGNMISSMDADMAHIEYNYLNLPQNISRSSASPAQASYTYDSDGSRLKLVYRDGDNNLTTVDWCGNLVYVNGALDKILFDGGFIRNGEYYFFATDHLGSIRAVTDSQGNILQATHYYPYGEEFADSSSSLDFQPYKFTGKEDQSYAGIPMTYFGARFLAHPYSQWTSIDPLAEKYYSLSPYNYCGGNPVNAVDPDGKKPTYKEALLMSMAVYQDKAGKVAQNQLKDLGWGTSSQLNTDSGLNALEFKNDKSGEYALAFAGTSSTKDVLSDFSQLAGGSLQYNEAISLAERQSSLRQDSEMTFVGHSLGGGEAVAASLATGRAAITFNPALLSSRTLKLQGLSKISANDITNYLATNNKGSLDVVTKIQRIFGLNNIGQEVKVSVGDVNSFQAHKIASFDIDNKK